MIHFWLEGLPAGDILGYVDYMGVRGVASAHFRLTSVFSNVQWISVDEMFY